MGVQSVVHLCTILTGKRPLHTNGNPNPKTERASVLVDMALAVRVLYASPKNAKMEYCHVSATHSHTLTQ